MLKDPRDGDCEASESKEASLRKAGISVDDGNEAVGQTCDVGARRLVGWKCNSRGLNGGG